MTAVSIAAGMEADCLRVSTLLVSIVAQMVRWGMRRLRPGLIKISHEPVDVGRLSEILVTVLSLKVNRSCKH
jgi:hypothetical protein